MGEWQVTEEVETNTQFYIEVTIKQLYVKLVGIDGNFSKTLGNINLEK